MSCSKLTLPEIGDKAHQPLNFSFPQHEFGNLLVVKRSFQAQWFQLKVAMGPWLHYDVNRAQAFCFSSVMTYKNNYKNNSVVPIKGGHAWLHYDVNRAQAFYFSSVMTYKNNYKNNYLLPQLL